jgi:hypothetical protein
MLTQWAVAQRATLKAEGYGSSPLSDAIDLVPLQTSAESMRAFKAQAHEIIDAITGMAIGAEAGLSWLRAEPPNLEKVQQTFCDIADAGKLAAEIVVRFRALYAEGAHSG